MDIYGLACQAARKTGPCGRGGWPLSRPQRSSANPEAPHKTIRRFLLSDTRTGGSLRRSNPSIHQALLVRQVAQVFQPEGHQKMFRRHKGIGRASPRASRPRPDQAARMQSTDQVAAALLHRSTATRNAPYPRRNSGGAFKTGAAKSGHPVENPDANLGFCFLIFEVARL